MGESDESRVDGERAAGRWRPLVERAAAAGFGLVVAWVLFLSVARVMCWDARQIPHFVRGLLSPPPPLGIHTSHPTLGYVHEPGARTRHRTGEFDVTYTIDATGARLTPGAVPGRPLVVLAGDSFTFGHGVNDDETWGAVLQARHWRALSVWNRGVMGWGTLRSALQLRADLERSERREPVRLVLYGWLLLHNARSLEFAGTPGWTWPQPYRATAGHAAASDGWLGRPWRVARALLRDMADVSAAHGAEFAVLVLPLPGCGLYDRYAARLEELLAEEGILCIGLHGQPAFDADGLLYPADRHPTPEYHRRVAAAVAAALPAPGSPATPGR